MSIRVAVGALSIALLVLTGCAGPQGWELRVDAEPGERYVLETISDVDMSMDLGPMGNQEVTNVMTMVMALEPLETTEEETRFNLGFDRIAVVVRFAESSMEYDTDGDNAGSPLAALDDYFRAVLDAEMEATVSSRGEVLSVTGGERISNATEYLQDPALQQLAAQLSDSFSGDALTAALQQSSPQFPEERVDVGDTWDRTNSVPNPMGTLTVVTTYTVAGEEEYAGLKCLKLDVGQTMTPEGESPVLSQLRQMAEASGGGVELRLGEMTGKGSVWVEIDTGVLAGGDLDSVLMADFDLTGVPGPTGEPVDLTMKMALNGNSKVNRIH